MASVIGDSSFAGADADDSDLNPRDKRGPRFSWTPAYEATFFRSLCESVQRGLRENHSFKSEAWDRAAQALRERHGAYPSKSHLINKSDNARKKFRLWRGLREHPDFLYNPHTKMVTGSDEAWKGHIEKEPLSRSLRGRPFEHEDFMEILYPDVIGSGGAPKRIIKPRRKGPDALQADESDTPGMAVIDLQGDSSTFPTPQRAATANMGAATANMGTAVPPPAPPPTQRPTSTTIPPRNSITSTSALTPPEDGSPHARKRFLPPDGASATNASGSYTQADKRRRTTGSHGAGAGAGSSGGSAGGSSNDTSSRAVDLSHASMALEDGIMALAEALKGRNGPPHWPSLAMEVFFRDFAEEDMDLQLKIAEKALTDENKAMVFCKMTPSLRAHWVKRLREVHNRSSNVGTMAAI